MAKFITGKELEDAVYDIIWEAEVSLLIVSPFIRLDEYFKKLFNKHLNNPNLHIMVVFGKNEEEVSRSLSEKDFEFFKKFLNVSIIYVPNLHGKYYANERMGVITSINLYDYSFKNNIEFGVCVEQNMLSKLTTNADQEAWNFSMQMANEHEAVFIKRPVYQKNLLSSLTGKGYIKSDVLHDVTEKIYRNVRRFSGNTENVKKTVSDFPNELILGIQNASRPAREQEPEVDMGYCIRTGTRIPYDPTRPLSKSAWNSWAKHNDMDYPEKFCHKTGRPSNGKTSMRNPILFH
jgi:hypothetical protein